MNMNRRAFLIGLAAAGVSCAIPAAKSQFFSQFPPGVFQNRAASDGSAVAFQGPGDIVGSALGFWSCSIAYTAAYASGAGNACDIADVGTGAISCTMKFATNGFPDLTSNSCSGGTLTVPAFCTANTSCVISKMYDQTGASACTGACDATQGTNANRPALTFNCLGTIPCATTNGTSSMLTTPNFAATHAQQCTETAVTQRSSGTTQVTIIGASGTADGMYFAASSASFFIYAGGTVTNVGASTGSPHAIQGVFNGASSVAGIDGSTTTVSPGAGDCVAGGANISLGGTPGSFLNGIIFHAGLWGTGFNGAQISNMNANDHTQYGF